MLIPFHWYLRRIDMIDGTAMSLAYCIMLAAGFTAVVLLANIRNDIFRLFVALVLAGSAFLVETYREVTQEVFSYEAFVQMYQSAGFAGDAAIQFTGHMLKPLAIAVLLFFGVSLAPARRRLDAVPRLTLAMFPVTTILLLSALAYSRGGDGLGGQPGAILPAAYAPLLALELARDKPRNSIDLPMAGAAGGDFDIVLIVDESVRADFLDIAVPGGLKSNLLGHPAVSNFGISAAATNCSTGSNLVLRYGGTRETYRQHIDSMPSLWQYARASELQTVYLDGQRTQGRLQNGMTEDERALIDEFVQFDDVPIVHRDIEIARKLATYSKNGRRDFIYVNKIGAHFPVHDKYPDAYMTYTPALDRGRHTEVSDTGDRTDFGDWPAYVNSYKNTLLWNVGEFFRVYLDNAALGNSVVIYTSDHGQNFHEDGSNGFGTHCLSNPTPEEGLVYTVVITEHDAWEKTFDDWAVTNAGHTSHYNIFPTVLTLLGYERQSVRRVYGPSVIEPTHDEMTFNSIFSARFGRKPKWQKVTPAAGGD